MTERISEEGLRRIVARVYREAAADLREETRKHCGPLTKAKAIDHLEKHLGKVRAFEIESAGAEVRWALES